MIVFDRVGKRLVLTEAGRIALDYADTVFKAGDELMSTLEGRPLANLQVLRVGAITTLSRNFQLEFLRPLVGRTDVELIVRSGTMRDLLAQLESHAIDVVLGNSAARRDAATPFRNQAVAYDDLREVLSDTDNFSNTTQSARGLLRHAGGSAGLQ